LSASQGRAGNARGAGDLRQRRSETDEKVQGFELGAVDFVSKPYQRDELLARVRTHLELNHLRNHLEDLVADRTIELRESEKKLRASLLDSITALASIVEMRDPYTAGHQRRVAQLAIAIARELQLTEEQVEESTWPVSCMMSARFKFRPKSSASRGSSPNWNSASSKSTHITATKYLKPSPFPGRSQKSCCNTMSDSMVPVIRRTQGRDILLEARILAVADVVEAIYSHRPYRPGWASKRHWTRSPVRAARVTIRKWWMPVWHCSGSMDIAGDLNFATGDDDGSDTCMAAGVG